MMRILSFINRIGRVLKLSFDKFQANKASTQGAALSFFMVFALPPILLLLVMIATLFLDDQTVSNWLLTQARLSSGQMGQDIVKVILDNATRPDANNVFAGAVSVGTLIFSATGIFAQLQDTLNTMWGVRIKPEVSLQRMIWARIVSFMLILASGLTVLLTILLEVGLAVVENFVTTQFEILSQIHLFQALNRGIFFVILFLLFAAVFRFIPDVKVRWRNVFAGALFTSLALSLSRFVIGWFLSTFNLGTAYGTLGSLIIFLFWLHLNMQIFLFGAEFTESWAKEAGAPLEPADYATWLPGRAIS